MENTRAYVSSSYPDLVAYRDCARQLLSRHHFDDRGMEDCDYVAQPGLVAKCIEDAESADLLILIVGFRYGTRLPNHGDKSLIEVEYEATRKAGRPVLAFVSKGEPPPEFDDRAGGDGDAIERFRDRLVADGLLVAFHSDLADFELLCDKALLAFRTRLVSERESNLGIKSGDGIDFFLRTYLETLIDRNKGLDSFYVPLAATTTSSLPREPWRDEIFGVTLKGNEAVAAEPSSDVELKDVADALDAHRQFYLAAESGGGKSLSLMAFEIAAARRYLIDRRSRFPLRVDVSSWTQEQDFEVLISRELKDKTGIAALPPGHLLLLIDGVIDSAAAPNDPTERIATWLRKHGDCKAVLAVRAQHSLEQPLPVVRIAPLDDPRVRNFVRKRLPDHRAAALLARLGFDIATPSASYISPFVRNPFNLTLICDLEARQKLPSNRVALMQTVLMKRAHESRLIPRPSWESLVEALGAVAIAMINHRANLAADIAWLRKVMPERESVNEVLSLAKDCGVMLEHAENTRYEFRHRLYLEYFAAEYLRRHREILDDVLEEPRYVNYQRVSRRFDEVIQVLVQLDEDLEIIESVAAYDPFLAATCLPLLSGDDDQRSRSEHAVVTSLGALFTDPNARGEAVAMLAQIGIPAITVLRRLQKDSRHFVRRSAVTALAQIRDPQAIEAVVYALGDPNRWVRDDARTAIRRFDETFRDVLVECIRRRIDTWRADPDMDRVIDALGNLIDDLPQEFGIEVANAAGIALEPVEEVNEELVPGVPAITEALNPDLTESRDGEGEEERPQDDGVSWGFHWLAAWKADHGNPSLAASGRSWLRATSVDVAWGFVWSALREACGPRDDDLEWLGRDWLAHASVKAGSWSHIWRSLFAMSSKDESLALCGENWLNEADSRRPGWNHVWYALWVADRDRSSLTRFGYRWLDEVDANIDNSWAVIWMTLWDAATNRTALIRIGRGWIARALPENGSWGFVWPRLWDELPGDKELISVGMDWLDVAPVEHGAWAYIWPRLRKHDAANRDLEIRGRRWLASVPKWHGGWYHVWELLWATQSGDVELVECARKWLAAAPSKHHGWVRVWQSLWNLYPGDPQLMIGGREWLKHSRSDAGWTYVCRAILKCLPGDSELLAMARAAFEHRSPSDQFMWRRLWTAQWDFGGEREWLEPVAREWLAEKGQRNSGFSFVWERLWSDHQNDDHLRRLALGWLKFNITDTKWSYVAEMLAVAAPRDAQLIEIATSVIDLPDFAHNWPNAWRILVDAGVADEKLLKRGVNFVRTYPPTRKGWPRVWCRLQIEDTDTDLLSLGWKLMQKESFNRRSWPDVWEALWRAAPLQRGRLSEIAADWLLDRKGRDAERISRWSEVSRSLSANDVARQEAVERLERTLPLRKSLGNNTLANRQVNSISVLNGRPSKKIEGRENPDDRAPEPSD